LPSGKLIDGLSCDFTGGNGSDSFSQDNTIKLKREIKRNDCGTFLIFKQVCR